jgi:hypothetical protein
MLVQVAIHNYKVKVLFRVITIVCELHFICGTLKSSKRLYY